MSPIIKPITTISDLYPTILRLVAFHLGVPLWSTGRVKPSLLSLVTPVLLTAMTSQNVSAI